MMLAAYSSWINGDDDMVGIYKITNKLNKLILNYKTKEPH
jgi:hypothetical protein